MSARLTVFTKPWKVPLPELARHIRALGFDGIEMPVRPGYSVTPENVTEELPRAVSILADHNLTIASIAGPTDERTLAACATTGVPIIRICVGHREDETYTQGEARLQREFEALVPRLAAHGVTLGIQNHSGAGMSAIRRACAVWWRNTIRSRSLPYGTPVTTAWKARRRRRRSISSGPISAWSTSKALTGFGPTGRRRSRPSGISTGRPDGRDAPTGPGL